MDFWSADPATGRTTRVTRFEGFDAGRPDVGGGRIVFDRGGRIEVLDPATGECRQVPIEIRSDADEARPYLRKANDLVTQVGISPDGARALVVARGEIFSVPKDKGVTRNLSRDPGSRDREATWSPDGKRIAFLSDRTGEVEIWLTDPLGSAEPLRLTTHACGYRHGLRWSPDSRKIAFSDETLTLFTVDVETRQVSGMVQERRESGDTLACSTDHEKAPKAPGARQAPGRGRPRVRPMREGLSSPAKRMARLKTGWYPGLNHARSLGSTRPSTRPWISGSTRSPSATTSGRTTAGSSRTRRWAPTS